jgi:hypothetical protein
VPVGVPSVVFGYGSGSYWRLRTPVRGLLCVLGLGVDVDVPQVTVLRVGACLLLVPSSASWPGGDM